MPGETDHLRSRLWSAVVRRRAPYWLVTLAPLAIAAAALPATRTLALAAMLPWAIWLAADAYLWRQRIAKQWPSWLNAEIPQLEDSSTLLAEDAHTPIARLQQQRLLARLASVLTAEDYQRIARARVRFGVLPIALSIMAAGAAWGF